MDSCWAASPRIMEYQRRVGCTGRRGRGESLSSDDEFRDGAMVKDKLLSTDRAKTETFVQEYARVSRQVRVAKTDRAAK